MAGGIRGRRDPTVASASRPWGNPALVVVPTARRGRVLHTVLTAGSLRRAGSCARLQAVNADVVFADSTEDAVERLAAAGPDAAPLAGGTWIMRAGLRGDVHPSLYVSLDRIPGLREIAVDADAVRIGAGATHAALAAALAGEPRLRGLHDAAARSANPAVRAHATVGGAVATTAFPASDLVPALLALDAAVTVATTTGTEEVALEDLLATRGSPGALVTGVTAAVPRRSAHARLTLRKAGDYPVAIASVAEAEDGVRVAIGSVEATPRRWRTVETGDPVAAARANADELTPRDGVEAPGWYRAQVLPTLLARALEAMA
jgi:aerobic carbon-monoxide dehydrogenase medium subunit